MPPYDPPIPDGWGAKPRAPAQSRQFGWIWLNGFVKHFQVLSAGKPVFFFEVGVEYADDELSDRNVELAQNIARVLQVEKFGPEFLPQLISKTPLVLVDQKPDHSQEGLKAWVSPKLRR